MNRYVLITAGNTSEPIDSVRSITNTGSGRLGSLIADEFYQAGVKVVYVCGKSSIQPFLPVHEKIVIEGVSDLDRAVKELSHRYSFDCIVHSMAVSDYVVKCVLPYEELERSIKLGIKPAAAVKSGKLSSEFYDPVIMLEKAPKIIGELRGLQPQALLVGFKLLAGVTQEELYKAAITLLRKNQCDFICANDLNNITGEKHEALLIGANGQYKKLETKKEIAEEIVKRISDIWRNTK